MKEMKTKFKVGQYWSLISGAYIKILETSRNSEYSILSELIRLPGHSDSSHKEGELLTHTAEGVYRMDQVSIQDIYQISSKEELVILDIV